MIKTSLIPTLISLMLSFTAFGQNGNYSMGARSAALAGSSLTLSDEWALFNNIGALADHQHLSVFGTYKNLYGISELSSIAAGATLPLWNGTLGLGAYRFGGDLLNEQRVNLGFSNRFGIVSLGLNVSYYQLNIENGGRSQNFMIDFGGRAEITPQLLFGAHISNINQAEITEDTGELVPTYMKSGLSYRPITSLMINAEVEKNLDDPMILKLGLEHQLINMLSLRLGFRTEPFISNFGLGFSPHKIKIDYSYSIHKDLGDIHQISFAYLIKPKE
ncbi:hypothetical protein [Reichenbachiella ulvae]|uniref:Type IX secretion system membrane protein, PorP/SprF family n=1 Tax=Reichenbachiella ulvae TaxID=2980104 RepID=A0ABT3CSJ6_9BACT|nr:hypothetical protein [Reichenbachiella ulvae]MCV9386587.1 hypothetical protein [Reichenbachiella ulvae]